MRIQSVKNTMATVQEGRLGSILPYYRADSDFHCRGAIVHF